MGGMSFKCPICEQWFLAKGSLRDHIRDKHEKKNVAIEGIGPTIYIRDNLQEKTSN